MEPYIASIVPDEVRQASDFGIEHIITNPPVIAQSGTNWRSDLARSVDLLKGDVHLQTTPDDPDSILGQVTDFSAMCAGRLVVKLPFTRSAMRALPDLRKARFPVNLTGVVNLAQGAAAVSTGADFVSVYVGRATASGNNGLELIRSLGDIVRRAGLTTRIIAASIHTPADFADVALAGADAAACPFDLLCEVIDDKVTDDSMRAFQEDWRRTTDDGA